MGSCGTRYAADIFSKSTEMKHIFFFLLATQVFVSAQAQIGKPDTANTEMGPLIIQPIEHATLVLDLPGIIICADPSNADLFKGMPAPDIILVTDIHGDHFDPKTLDAIKKESTLFIVPQVVADKWTDPQKKQVVVLKNGDQTTRSGIVIRAIPMYNLPESPTAMHTKGRGNGYVLSIGGKQIYISGDTQGIPEMRSLKNIDIAFVCMNLPYTMDVKEAADAVLAFKPRIVYPYHYRGKDGFSDINAFKNMVEAGNKNIEVRIRNWYPSK